MKNSREMLATVVYINEIFNPSAPIVMKVYLKDPSSSYYSLKGTKLFEDEISLEDLYDHYENREKIKVFHNRTPTYNETSRIYQLDFGTRVKIASIKNFILE